MRITADVWVETGERIQVGAPYPYVADDGSTQPVPWIVRLGYASTTLRFDERRTLVELRDAIDAALAAHPEEGA